jgi:phosphoribosylformylglycinamidine cyclo-ligase
MEAYRRTGVDLAAGRSVVDVIRDLAAGTAIPGVREAVGGFAGLFDLGDGRLLAAAADGVGTKLEVARLAGRLDTVGIDLVAMSANDVVCTGARPLFFLDYVAVERLVPEEVAAVVSGVAEGCRRAGCALLGGETAEHPGVMDGERIDLAGFCVGMVDGDRLLGPHLVRSGDALVGLLSTGLHANGFSLVRSLLLGGGEKPRLRELHPLLGRSLADELLEPTALYVRPLLALAGEGQARSAAHITGGGWGENLPRALPDGLRAVVDTSGWTRPPIFDLVAERADLAERDLFDVLNMGIGMVVVVPPDGADAAVAVAGEAGAAAVMIGRVEEGEATRYVGA